MKNWMVGLFVIGLVGIGFMLSGCGENVPLPPTTTTTVPILPKVATPTFITVPGSYETNALVVTIECATPGADIYYVISSATASEALPKTTAASATGPGTVEVTLERSDSVRAFAVKTGYRNSDAVTASYDLYGWQALNGGLENDTYTLLVTNGDLYAGGSFDFAGNYVPNTSKIAKWDGFSWSSIGGPEIDIYSSVRSIIKVDNYLYAGGYFDVLLAGVPGTNNIARWDINNSTWEALGAGVGSVSSDDVNALACDGTYVYVAGYFSDASGVAFTQGIARWNIAGQIWEALGTGISGPDIECMSLYLYGGYLYAGGYVSSFGGVGNTVNIARWNIATEKWEALGNGLDDQVLDLYHDGTHLYAGGWFTKENGSVTPLNRIAKWDGASWSVVGNGSDDEQVQALTGFGNYIYAGGNFETMSGVPETLHIARWDKVNSTWEAVGAGLVGDEIEELIFDAEGNLYFGGDDISGDPSGVGLINIGKRGKIE